MWMLPPPEIATEVFTEMPAALRRPGRDTAWATANKGAPLDSFLEGPAFDADGNLWCTDIPHGRVFRIDPSGNWTQVAEYDGEPNGLKFAPDGHIWLADYRNGIMRLDRDSGQVTPVLERRRAERFRGPNDLIFAKNGDLYFTDQGQTGMHDPTGRVYRLGADGRLDCLISNGPSPNGLILDAEEKFLYVAMTRSNEVWRMPLLPEGGTTKVQVFARFFGGNSGPDGMALDRDGNVAVAHAGLGCIFQVDKLGQPRRIVRSCRGLTTTNLAYGGANMDQMFITDSATGTILCAQMDVAADPLPFR